MEFIFESLAVVEGADAAASCSCGIATLDYETWYQAVEDCAVVVAV